MPSDALLARCAKSWDLRNLVFVRKMENIVFSCDSGVGKVYLRLTTPLRRARQEIEAEINWIDHLAKCHLPVPHIIPNNQGHKVVSFTEGSDNYEAVVFSAIAGEHPSKEMVVKPEFLRTLGALIAKMHLASQRYEGTHQGFKREEWFEERGLRHALAAAATSTQTILRQRLEQAVTWMKQLPRTPETYGLIHADLGALNLFISDDGSIAVIDFDDSCHHWFAFDLAIVVYSMALRFNHMTRQTNEATWLKNLVEGYRTIRPLTDEEIDWIPKFIDFAFLRLFFWIEHHESLHTFYDDAIEHTTQLKQNALSRLL
ncbi:MAG TPA: phosphotransferase [Chlamydiales bacterium]|nr:phosphotransferase [Chlamydiales bacterium]